MAGHTIAAGSQILGHQLGVHLPVSQIIMIGGHWAVVDEVAVSQHALEPGLKNVLLQGHCNCTNVHGVGKNALVTIRFAHFNGEVDVNIEAAIKVPLGDHFQVDRAVDGAYGEVIEELGIELGLARLEEYAAL